MNNAVTSSGSSAGSLHRISEDSRFRPFLTTHFDAEGFTRSAIRDGRSEDVFRDLDGLVGEVNDAIKGFVAVHKHDLMGGMQDVAVLASRYHALQALSSRAKMSVERLKKDVRLCSDCRAILSLEVLANSMYPPCCLYVDG
jgi:hypothetical protein